MHIKISRENLKLLADRVPIVKFVIQSKIVKKICCYGDKKDEVEYQGL